MALEPLSLRKMEEQTSDVYEAVTVMTRRARQILQDRLVGEVMQEAGLEDLGVFDQAPETDPDDYVELDKPTTMAVEEFMSGRLKWRQSEEEAE